MKMDREIREERRNKLKEDRHYCVYVHTNKTNGKMYVGLTGKKPEERWKRGSSYKSQVFGNAINKYGWNNFEHCVIASGLTLDEASEFEQTLISQLKTNHPKYGYNIAPGGYNNPGSTKQLLCFDRNGNFVKCYKSIEEAHNILGYSVNQLRCAANGSSEYCGKYYWSFYDCTIPISVYETTIKEKLSNNFKPILQFDLSGKFIREFTNIMDLREYTKSNNLLHTAILYAIQGKKKSYGGYIWRHKDVTNDGCDLIGFDIYTERYSKIQTAKTVYQFDCDGNLINTYYSMSAAARKMNIAPIDIQSACKGIYKTSCGFMWRTSDQIEDPKSFKDELLYNRKINEIQVCQLTNDGYRIRVYHSIVDAVNNHHKETDVVWNIEELLNACTNKTSLYGYRWCFLSDVAQIEKKRPRMGERASIVQFDMHGNYMNIYQSVKSAAETNCIGTSGIILTCRGEKVSAGKSMWKYASDCDENFIREIQKGG